MRQWSEENIKLLSPLSCRRFIGFKNNPELLENNFELRAALLDFIADMSSWENSKVEEYLKTSRTLTSVAHASLGGQAENNPLLFDPFAGGGGIPLEGIRMGTDVFSSDLNPVSVLLNKVILEYVPKYGQKLFEETRRWGSWVKTQVQSEARRFYPEGSDGDIPIAYIWARTIRCEGPDCGVQIPLIHSFWLAKTGKTSTALRLVPNEKNKAIGVEIIQNAKEKEVREGTVKRGAAICPLCGFTTPAENVRIQLRLRKGGTNDARLLAVVSIRKGVRGRVYRLPSSKDYEAVDLARATARIIETGITDGGLSVFPSEPLPYLRSIFNVHLLGIEKWEQLFTARQLISMHFLREAIAKVPPFEGFPVEQEAKSFHDAVITVLALALDKMADSNSSLCGWRPTSQDIGHTFGRQALGIVWDFAEINIFSGSTRDWSKSIEGCISAMSMAVEPAGTATVQRLSADQYPLPSDYADILFTDPPYYDSVPYADLSDFFYVWLKRSIGKIYPDLFSWELTPKESEIVQLSERNKIYSYKTRQNYESLMTQALAEARRVLSKAGIGIVVFAHKRTEAWETQLQAMVDAGWTITASWPIDTEKGSRLRALGSAVLASSIHLVCRPRNDSQSKPNDGIAGDWRDVLAELPHRIHEWMPRLAEEGVVGADAIFSCLGPALEVFSRYPRVEKASGEIVTLKEYLEQVWAAVAKEALTMIFTGADAAGFEEDARITAMWLWTLKTGNGNGGGAVTTDDEGTADEENGSAKKIAPGAFVLEYDAARKIAQGLGAHLEKLSSVVEVKGEIARLLPVSERTSYLFGKDTAQVRTTKTRKKAPQMKLSFMQEIEEITSEEGWGINSAPRAGSTVLDRLHQVMILFAAGRSEALRRFLIEEGAGNDQRFWRLAQALSALYPSSSEEKRWVDGVLARKKGLGF